MDSQAVDIPICGTWVANKPWDAGEKGILQSTLMYEVRSRLGAVVALDLNNLEVLQVTQESQVNTKLL